MASNNRITTETLGNYIETIDGVVTQIPPPGFKDEATQALFLEFKAMQ